MYLSSVSSRLLLHDVNSWDLKKSYGCYEGILRDISWSDDGKYLLQVNPKGLVEILTSADNDIRSLQHVPFRDTWSASFHRDGHRNVAIGTKSGNVLIWDTKNKTIIKTFPTPAQHSAVNFVSFNSKNTSLAASMQNGDTVIYGLVSNIPVSTVKLACSKSISAMKFHHESRGLIGLATDEGHIVLRDVSTNKDKVFFENVHASPVSDITYSLVNKDVMLSSGYDKIMHVYDIRLQSVVSTIQTSNILTSLTINSENQVALGTKNGPILIYDLRDLTNHFKILKGHDEEVSKVCFQPIRKKTISTEISLREDTENMSPMKLHSPVKKRTSDIFYINDSPARSNLDMSEQAVDTKADSFLVMLGLDKSNNDLDEVGNTTMDFKSKSDKDELRYRQLDAERNISKASTPLNSRTADNIYLPSPICITNGTAGDCNGSALHLSNIKQIQSNGHLQISTSKIDTKAVEDLKDFVKLTLANDAHDNKNYYLNVMMALTKQKLFLEKQFNSMNEQIQTLVQNQNALVEINRNLVQNQNALVENNRNLVEINRKLALDVDILKSQQNSVVNLV